MKNKIILNISLFIFLLSCGYSPILTKKDYPFKINNIEKIGNKKINSIISKKITGIDNKNNGDKIQSVTEKIN